MGTGRGEMPIEEKGSVSLRHGAHGPEGTGVAASPFVHKFQTQRNHYVFDVNTGEIVRVDALTWKILDDSCLSCAEVLSKHTPEFTPNQVTLALHDIWKAREEERLFANFRPEIRLPYDRALVTRMAESCREQLILNVTERCNFRCTYCPFTYRGVTWRNHSDRDMTWETAHAAIDDFLQHCKDRVLPTDGRSPVKQPPADLPAEIGWDLPPSISFYGGEPLLNFPLIRRCVEYVHEKAKDRTFMFSLSTNGSLLRGEVADFLAAHRFHVRVSLDGPAAIHDKHRVTDDGSPTWALVVENLITYMRRHPDKLPSIASTIPCTAKVADVQRFFQEADWIPSGVAITPALESEAEGNDTDSMDDRVGVPCDLPELYSQYYANLKEGRGNGRDGRAPDRAFEFQDALFGRPFRNLHTRRQVCGMLEHRRLPAYFAAFTTCVVGTKRTFVSVTGHYYPCERIPECETYRLGSVSTGLDLEKVYTLVKYFVECTHEQCKYCWCLPICTIGCYAGLRKGAIFVKALKERRCAMLRELMHNQLADYCELLEANPHALDYVCKHPEKAARMQGGR